MCAMESIQLGIWPPLVANTHFCYNNALRNCNDKYMTIKHLDIKRDFLIERCGGGIKFVRPEPGSGLTQVGSLMEQQFNVYFVNAASEAQDLNNQTLAACGWDSTREVLGKSVIDVWGESAALREVIVNDREVMTSKTLRIAEEEVICSEGLSHSALSFKWPWHATDEKIAGLLGCTLVTGMPGYVSLPEFLATLVKTGLLNTAATPSCLPGLMLDETYYSKREKQVIYYMLRGNSAKRIARVLNISHRTVERHFENIRIKAGVRNKSELIEKLLDYFRIQFHIG